MGINLGSNPIILILVIFLEILLIIIPNKIASLIEKKTFKEELISNGFVFTSHDLTSTIFSIFQGILIGLLFLYVGTTWLSIFFIDILAKNLFGEVFVENAMSSAITIELMDVQLIELIIIVILQIIVIGPCEEGFFRGFILKRIKNKKNNSFALIVSSICFAIYHTPPIIVPFSTIITYFGYYFTFGLLFGLVYIKNDESLLPCIVAHSLFNILVLLF